MRETLETNKRKFDDSAYKQAILTEIPKRATADRPGNWFRGCATLVADEP